MPRIFSFSTRYSWRNFKYFFFFSALKLPWIISRDCKRDLFTDASLSPPLWDYLFSLIRRVILQEHLNNIILLLKHTWSYCVVIIIIKVALSRITNRNRSGSIKSLINIHVAVKSDRSYHGKVAIRGNCDSPYTTS